MPHTNGGVYYDMTDKSISLNLPSNDPKSLLVTVNSNHQFVWTGRLVWSGKTIIRFGIFSISDVSNETITFNYTAIY